MEREEQNDKYRWILGIYIFRNKLDTCLIHASDGRLNLDSFNYDQSTNVHLKEWIQRNGSELGREMLCCVGHTGHKTKPLVQYLLSQEADVWLENLERIKRMMKRLIGRAEKLNASLVADYAFQLQNQAVLVNLSGSSLEQLKDLQGNRSRLVKAMQIIQTGIQELKAVDEESCKTVEYVNKDALHGLEKSLKQAEEKIMQYMGMLKLSLRRKG